MKQPMCVGLEGTLFDCLKTINEGGQGIAFILDSDRKVVGCVTRQLKSPSRGHCVLCLLSYHKGGDLQRPALVVG